MKIQRILVPVDFSPCSRAALEHALSLAETFRASVDVLHVWTSPAYVSPTLAVMTARGSAPETLESIARKQAEGDLDELLNGVQLPPGVEVHRRIEFGFEADAIVAAAQGYDLVVVGTHGRSGLKHLVLGSVAEKVVRRSPVPVMTVRGP